MGAEEALNTLKGSLDPHSTSAVSKPNGRGFDIASSAKSYCSSGLENGSSKGGSECDITAAGNGIDAIEDIILPVRPKTEDFLTFLCFRGEYLL